MENFEFLPLFLHRNYTGNVFWGKVKEKSSQKMGIIKKSKDLKRIFEGKIIHRGSWTFVNLVGVTIASATLDLNSTIKRMFV